jgi:hypothetical protein
MGLSVGTIFIIYEPLMPITYSIGGIILALATMLIAAFYGRLMNVRALFWVLMAGEAVTFGFLAAFLALGASLVSAIIVYIGYQVTFAFGSYILRAETVLLRRTKLFSLTDVAKQAGYLAGLALGALIYQGYEIVGISDKITQVYLLHYLLLALQAVVIGVLVSAFAAKRSRSN